MDKKIFSSNYSVDYLDIDKSQKFNQIPQNKPTKVVTAKPPILKKSMESTKHTAKDKIEDEHIAREKSKQPTTNDDICINIKASRKVLFYKVLYCCFILLFTSLGIYIFSSAIFFKPQSVGVSSLYKNEYYELLSPIVMNDPAPFGKPEYADVQMVVASSIWKLISDNGTQKYNTFDEKGFSLIPTSDVIKASQELFGENYFLNLNESIFGSFFTFYAGEDNFHISAISNQNSCIPFIKELTETDNCVILNVGYVTRDDKFLKSDSQKAKEPTPIKYMKYTLKKNIKTDSHYIYSVENC